MAKRYRFLVSAFAGCVAILAVVGGINWAVDPHAYFGNNLSSMYVDNDRYAKREIVGLHDHDALLMGSSKVAAIDPDDIMVGGHRFFNAALVSATPEEILFLFEDIEDVGRLVIIGLDFYMFNGSKEPFQAQPHTGVTSLGPWYRYVFNIGILESSIDTVLKSLRGSPPVIFPDGQRNQEVRQRIDAAYEGPHYEKVLKHLRTQNYGDFVYEERRVEMLRLLRRALERRGVEAIVFINPINVAVRELIADMGLDPQLERFRRDVRSVFPDLIDLSESQWAAPPYFYWTDPWHYRPSTGAEFLNEMLRARQP